MTQDSSNRLFRGDDWETLERALETWGDDTQEMHAIEEIGELMAAMMQYRRHRANQMDVCDEIADVLIVANQLAMMYGRAEVEERIEYKMNRLGDRLEEDTE